VKYHTPLVFIHKGSFSNGRHYPQASRCDLCSVRLVAILFSAPLYSSWINCLFDYVKMITRPVRIITAKKIHLALTNLGNPDIAAHSMRFFKTGQGKYGEGDRFLGIRVPVLRRKAKEFKNTPLSEILCVLHSSFHEERLLALFMLVNKFSKGQPHERKDIYELYLKN